MYSKLLLLQIFLFRTTNNCSSWQTKVSKVTLDQWYKYPPKRLCCILADKKIRLNSPCCNYSRIWHYYSGHGTLTSAPKTRAPYWKWNVRNKTVWRQTNQCGGKRIWRNADLGSFNSFVIIFLGFLSKTGVHLSFYNTFNMDCHYLQWIVLFIRSLHSNDKIN